MLRRCGRRSRRRRGAGPVCAPTGRDSPQADRTPPRPSHRLDAHEREQHHACKHEAVTETGDLSLAVAAAGVADGNLDRLEAELRGAEDQLEITERVEVPEVAATGLQARIVDARYRLRSAQRIGEALRQTPGEQQREALVGDEIEKAHRLILHRIDQARAVDELALAGAKRVPELRQLLRGHGEIGVEDHQHVAARGVEAGEDGIALAGSQLTHRLDVEFGMRRGDALDLLPGAVARMTFDEDDLELLGETGNAPDRRFDVARSEEHTSELQSLRHL